MEEGIAEQEGSGREEEGSNAAVAAEEAESTESAAHAGLLIHCQLHFHKLCVDSSGFLPGGPPAPGGATTSQSHTPERSSRRSTRTRIIVALSRGTALRGVLRHPGRIGVGTQEAVFTQGDKRRFLRRERGEASPAYIREGVCSASLDTAES